MAQPAAAQTAEVLLTVQDHNGKLAREFGSSLRGDRQAGWRRGWRRAHDIGPAATAVLRRLLVKERIDEGRLVLLGALAAASGANADNELLDLGSLSSATAAERLMSCFAVALGPVHPGPDDAVRAFLLGLRDPASRVAAGLALSRFDAATPLPVDWFRGAAQADPGLAAAAVLCGGHPSLDGLVGWLEQRGESAWLVARAALLTEHRGELETGRLRELAMQSVSRTGDDARALRRAAALHLSRSRRAGGPVLPPGELVVLFASAAPGRRAALLRGWLDPVPSSALPIEVQRQLVVGFALAAPPARLTAALVAWRGQPELARDAYLALAWRVYGRGEQLGLDDAPALPDDVAECAWLQLALGRRPQQQPSGDAQLDAAVALAAKGRLPAALAAAELEQALWRRGSHPGVAAHRCRTELLRDLLLSGSDYVRAARSRRFPYLPRGLKPGNRRFFVPAFDFFRWFAPSPWSVPAAVRLE